MDKIILLIFLCFLAPTLTYAQTETESEPIALAEKLTVDNIKEIKSEIVYRASLGRADDIKLLLSQGASANQTNKEGIPVLSLASSRRDPEGMLVVQALLAGGADVNGKDANGQTALFYAVRSSSVKMVKLLLDSKIDYYAPDKKGEIARTLAFRLNKKVTVNIMDDFVKAQTAAVQKQYQDINDAIAEENKKKEEAQKQAQQLAKEQAERIQAEKAAKDAEIQAKQALQSTRTFESLTQALAFENCAFQYWSYVKLTTQKSELTDEEIDAAIDMHKERIIELGDDIMNDYAADAQFVDKLSEKSKQLIFAKIDNMPSKTERFQRGIGKISDADERCRQVGKHWEEMQIEPKRLPDPLGPQPQIINPAQPSTPGIPSNSTTPKIITPPPTYSPAVNGPKTL